MNILLAGATGFLGRPLYAALIDSGHSVTVVSRDPGRATAQLPSGAEVIAWGSGPDGPLEQTAAASDAIINLSGESIAAHRWTPEFKEQLRSSRLTATRRIVEALRKAGRPDVTLLNASAVGYYGDTGDRTVTESSPPENDFLAQLCVAWEAEAQRAEEAGSRVIRLRFGVVLGEGGALEKMLTPFRLGLGGPMGSGRQWVSWIHREDVVGLILWAMGTPEVRGPLNVTAPHPIRQREFAKTLGRVLGRPAVAPAPAFALKLLLGEFANSVLTGQKVLPERAQSLGYTWKYPTLEPALRAILTK